MKILRSFIRKTTVIHNLALIWIFFVLISSNPVNATEEDDLRRAAESYGAPLIQPAASEMTALVMEEFRIPCQSSSPVTWVAIHTEHDNITNHHLNIEYDIDGSSRFPYVATLVFPSVSVDDVSFYYCLQNKSMGLAQVEADLENEVKNFRAARTYLFVQDEANPLVNMIQSYFFVKQFETYTIPCKPSYKDVQVEIVRTDDEQRIKYQKYDPKTGFDVKLREIHDSGSYTCRLVNQDDPSIPFDIQILASYNELEARTDFVTIPNINSTSEGGFVYVDSSITLFCYVDIKAGVKYNILWEFKGRQLQNSYKYEISTISEHPSEHSLQTVGTRSLTILNAALSDNGNYKCTVQDHNNHTNEHVYRVNVVEEGASKLTLTTSQTSLESKQGATINLVFEYSSFPNATFEVMKDGMRVTSQEGRYELKDLYKQHKVLFAIMNVHVEDSGNYTIEAYNGLKTKRQVVQVFVKGSPMVELYPREIYGKLGQKFTLFCTSISYPLASFEWSYRNCPVNEWKQCTASEPRIWPQDIINFDDREEREEKDSKNVYTKTANLSAYIKFPGLVRCSAQNSEGPPDVRTAYVMVGDLDEPVTVWRQHSSQLVAQGDEVHLECGVIKYNFTRIIQWKFGNTWIDETNNETKVEMEFNTYETDYSYRSILVIKEAQLSDGGQYTCVAQYQDATMRPLEKKLHLTVNSRKQAFIAGTNLTSDSIVMSLGDPLDMYCEYRGIPVPEVVWTKDDELLTDEMNNVELRTVKSEIDEEALRSIVRITAVKVEHEGEYKCKVINKDGEDSRTTKLVIKNRPFKYLLETTIGVFIFIFLLVLCTIYLCVRVKKERDMVRALKKAGLANFEEGDIDRINPDLDLNEQADLLPYDRRFEFPRDKLKLGQQLGAGAFGVVVKGIAQGIIPYEEESTVAVKMVKANTDDEIMRALISELKIMVHLGQHLNVVNLLGAVTKNIARREVMVIVEYCRFGNVQKFLLKHRTTFVDQIKKDTDEIDPDILENEYRWSNNSVYNIRASNNTFNPSGHVNSQGYVRHSGFGVDSAGTEATLISRGDESERPLSSGYQSEYRGPVRTVTTSDLVCWAFQVARGMDYLASRKVLHGDLAARNILLCDNNIVKICDFGLARSLYNNENYKKNNETPLPFKWLALESLSDQVFSTYSDIWAFGVTMWEFFSLAQTPYPGIDPNRDLYLQLMKGYRMERPKYANQRLYDIMLSCWNQRPDSRPLFHQLEKQLSALLEDGVKDHYVDLNEPYLLANTEYLKTNPDYLAMLGPPDHMAPPVPPMATHEEFHVPDQEAPPVPSTTPGYINMQPLKGTAIYTPNAENASDDEDANVRQPLNKKTSPVQKPPRKSKERQIKDVDDDGPGEDIPMLERSEYKDLMPRHPRETVDSNQYVNVPSAKQRQDAVSNPSYIVVNNVNERN